MSNWLKCVFVAAFIYIAGCILIASIGHANDREMYLIGSGPDRVSTTKLGAMRALLSDANTVVYRCNEVELTEKATIRNKKKLAKRD
jgi:hypothetical protein